MDQRKKLLFGGLLIVLLGLVIYSIITKFDSEKTNYLKATVLTVSSDSITVKDSENLIYTFDSINDFSLVSGDIVILEYTGVLDKSVENQNINIVNYTVNNTPESDVVKQDMFKDFYELASTKLATLSLDEKIGQLLLVRVPEDNKISDLKKYHFGGYLLFERDFQNKTKAEVIDMIREYQSSSNIPLFIAVDEEGGRVVRVSSNSNLVPAPFKSPQELYQSGGFDLIKKDTVNKSSILSQLGINLNLAPVVDISDDPSSYIYDRTVGLDIAGTSEYASTVIEASKKGKVSYVLKHFPGYGENTDTHTGISIDNRNYDEILNDALPPFKAGVDALAEAILVSHNIINSIDSTNPASLSTDVHNILRSKLGFTGISITDDLSMDAIADNVDGSAAVKAILAGNDILIVTDYANSFSEIKEAIIDGDISEEVIDDIVLRVLAWKYYKGMMLDTVK